MARVVTFGETMLRLSPARPGRRLARARDWRVEPGGSESNVAIALAQLGHGAAHCTRLPAGPLGDLVAGHLRELGVDVSLLERGGERVGCYWTEAGSGPRPGRVVYDRAGSAFAEWGEGPDWRRALDGADWLHASGITPALGPGPAGMLEAALAAAAGRAQASLDLNHRATLWRWLPEAERARGIADTMTRLCGRCGVLMGNESDFAEVFGWPLAQAGDAAGRYRPVAEKAFAAFGGLRALAVSLRTSHSASDNDWSGLLFVAGEDGPAAFQGPELRLQGIVDRVGAGDAFAAGIIHGLAGGLPPQETVDFAVALGALKHTLAGDACTFSEQEVRQVLASGGSGRIIR